MSEANGKQNPFAKASKTSHQNTILSLFALVSEDQSWSFAGTSRKETSYATHSYHRYPAKFIPQLARRCIEQYSLPGDVVCDPFMGCGTTLVETLLAGRKAMGVDINPIAYLITKAKTTPIDPKKLESEVNKVLTDISVLITTNQDQSSLLPNTKWKPVIPSNERINYWFPNAKIREELGLILGRIKCITDVTIKTFCLCAFSNILRGCSIWLMKSVKPTRDLDKKMASPFKSFQKQLKAMARGNEKFYALLPAHIKKELTSYSTVSIGDAKKLPFNSNAVNLVVTSPPYITSYEYADLHQLSALWLGYTKSVADFRTNFIGSIHRKDIISNGVKSEIAKQVIDELTQKDPREGQAAYNYFLEMQQCFEEIHRVLKAGGKTCIVIGNTALKKVNIPNAEIFVELMQNIGFKIYELIKRRIPSKILPSTRDSRTGRFTSNHKADRLAYAYEYILVMEKK